MSTLPFETLSLIFGYLERRDWLQCQLTSKKWYEASTVFLYSKVTVNTLNKSRLYVNTLNNSSRLGEYLKTIDTTNIFQFIGHTGGWDEHELLNTIIQQCPNLLNIRSKEPDISFWSRILYAATQGQLSRLQSLPGISGKSFETGVYATLLFKKTLTSIHLESPPKSSTQLRAYQLLQDQMKEFKNLQMLHISYISNKQLSSFDELIEKCPYLKELSIINRNFKGKVITESGTVINPRSDIKKLTSNWEMINTENQLIYLIQKFPSLDRLVILGASYDEYDMSNLLFYPSDVVFKILLYTTTIPSFDIQFRVRDQDLTNIWIHLMNMNDGYRDIIIKTLYNHYSSKVDLRIQENFKKIIFYLHKDSVNTPRANFFLQTGHMIRSLKVDMGVRNDHGVNRISWIFKAIKSCPSLQKLTLYSPDPDISSLKSRSVFQHTSIKKLTVTKTYIHQRMDPFFEQVSLRLPNIRYLYLNLWFLSRRFEEKGTLTLFMPDAQLDLLNLIIEDHPYYMKNNGGEKIMYIRLEANSVQKFYKSDSTRLVIIAEEVYMMVYLEVRLNITCKILKNLKINMEGKQRIYRF